MCVWHSLIVHDTIVEALDPAFLGSRDRFLHDKGRVTKHEAPRCVPQAPQRVLRLAERSVFCNYLCADDRVDWVDSLASSLRDTVIASTLSWALHPFDIRRHQGPRCAEY